MNVFEIIGPAMVGPSSSHTAGAVKLGLAARRLFGKRALQAVKIDLYGSFLATGVGHGTDRAILAGLLEMQPDDMRIPDSLSLAKERGIHVEYGEADLKNAHPNTAVIEMYSESGETMVIQGASLGGGRILITRINRQEVAFSGEYPTLIVSNKDLPGCVAEVAQSISSGQVNIAKMNLYRDSRHGNAVMILECDEEIPEELCERIRNLSGVTSLTYFAGK